MLKMLLLFTRLQAYFQWRLIAAAIFDRWYIGPTSGPQKLFSESVITRIEDHKRDARKFSRSFPELLQTRGFQKKIFLQIESPIQ